MGNDERVPELNINIFGYMYLTDNEVFASVLRESHATQLAEGAATELMSPEQIKAAYPSYQVDDIVLGSINRVDEGFWDATAVFDWWRKSGRDRKRSGFSGITRWCLYHWPEHLGPCR